MNQPRKTPSKNLLLTTNQPTRSDEMLIIAVLIALLLLIGIAGLFWSTWSRIAFAPTPTPTITRVQKVTSTPDIRATQNVAQLQTAAARQVAILSQTETSVAVLVDAVTQTAAALSTSDIVSAVVSTPNPRSDITLIPNPTIDISSTTPITNSIQLPFVPGSTSPDQQGTDDTSLMAADQTALVPPSLITATVQSEDIAANNGNDVNQSQQPLTNFVPVAINPVSQTDAPELQATTVPQSQPPAGVTPLPTATPIAPPTLTPTLTPSEPTLAAPPIETPTLTSTPTRFVQSKLKGIVNVDNAKLLASPRGASRGDLAINLEMELTSRTVTGEWIDACCLNGAAGWLRQSQLLIEGNTLDSDAPTDANANDVRWLKIDGDPSQTPPQVLPISAGTFPFLRGNLANHGTVGELPSASVVSIWQGKQGQASGRIISPITISNNGIFVSTDDGQLYSFNKETGDLRWRWRYEGDPPRKVTRFAAVINSQLYLVDDSGTVYRLEDGSGNTSATQTWRTQLKIDNQADAQSLAPATGIATYSDCLVFGAVVQETSALYLVSIRQSDGNQFCFTANRIEGTSMQHIAIGGDLIFAATDRGIFARDAVSGDNVWGEPGNYPGISLPPVYSYPGVDALAELYITDNTGNLYALDANTGERLWAFASGQPVLGLALNDKHLYAAGAGFVKVISREEHGQIANIGTNGSIITPPLLSPSALLAVADSGEISIISADDQEPSRAQTGIVGIGHYVANGQILYVHDGQVVHAFRGQ